MHKIRLMTEITAPKNNMTKVTIAVILMLLVVIFSIQNSSSTPVKVYFWEVNAPLVLLFVICVMLGILAAIIALWPISRYSKKTQKLLEEQKTRIEFLEQQLTQKDKDIIQ